jgi:hypothetical protein
VVGLKTPFSITPRAKEFLDEAQDVAVGHLGRDRRHDDRVREVIEETLDVGVQHKPVAAFMVFEDPRDGPVAVASRAEAVGRVVKLRLEDRRQETPKHLLRDPIPNRRDAQRTEFAVAFVDELAAQGLGLKPPGLEIAHHRLQVGVEVGRKHLDADLVDAGGSAIALDRMECGQHKLRGDAPGERVNFLTIRSEDHASL